MALSGMKNIKTSDQTNVMRPKMINSQRHEANGLWISPIAYPRTPPKTEASPFPANHMPCLRECSDGLYHKPVIKLKPGLMMLSNTPRKTRRMIRDEKLEAAPWHM